MKKQLFLLHFAGGDCYSYQFITPFLNKFSIIPLELPGRGNRIGERLLKDYNDATKDIFTQILDRLNGTEFIIYGHSMGALMGLQVTRLLERANKSPSHLFVSGCEPPMNNDQKRRYLLEDEALIKEIAEYGGIPMEICENKEFLDFFLPILRADLEIAEKDSVSINRIQTPIFAMMGDKEEGAENIANWKELTESTFNFRIFSGGHFFIHNHARSIAKIIS